jgi:hypothetical protein
LDFALHSIPSPSVNALNRLPSRLGPRPIRNFVGFQIFIAALLLLNIASATGQVRPHVPEPMVCSGMLSVESRVMGPGPPQYASFIGYGENGCMFLSGSKSAAAIFQKCKPGETCTVEAMVVRNGDPQIFKVIAVLKGSLNDVDCNSAPPEWLKYCQGE